MTGGLFITFEGCEGAGKTSQVSRLVSSLSMGDWPLTITREPGATPMGLELRRLLLDSPAGAIPPRAEALLFAADRAAHAETVIRPALQRGHVVICDRFVDSSVAYQGHGRQLGAKDVAWLSSWGTQDLTPDLVVLLDIEPRLGLARVLARGGSADRIEAETLQFHDRVRQGFLDRADADPFRYLVLDATQDADLIADLITTKVNELLLNQQRPWRDRWVKGLDRSTT